MRRIDADALKETISKYEFTAPNEMYKHGGECVLNFYMPKIIDDAPTVDAEFVRHGEWLDSGINGTVSCSLCMFTDFFAKQNRVMLFKYCPGCGARMDGGKNNDLC